MGIEAIRADPLDHVVLQARGEDSQPHQTNYFVGALGELIQHMTHPDARYGFAFPDSAQYRALVRTLPRPAWDRLRLVVYFVGRTMPEHGYRVDPLRGPP